MTGIRPARAEDAKAIAGIEMETWRVTYPGMLPDNVLVGMSERRLAASWVGLLRRWPRDVLVAIDPREGIIGFGHCGPQRGVAIDFAGEIFTLYVATDHQGKGVGRRLLLALFARLHDSGCDSALVWVIRANPARFFYERFGGRQVAHRPIPVGGEPVEAVAYGWSDLAAVLAGQSRRLTGEGPGR
jgi:ribosomal protein S18 acetylase RimI-like enzyme